MALKKKQRAYKCSKCNQAVAHQNEDRVAAEAARIDKQFDK